MEGTKRIPLGVRKKSKGKKKNKRLIRSIVSYLNSDPYLFAPLFSDSPPSNSESSTVDEIPAAGSEALGMERVKRKKKRRMLEKVKEYIKFNNHMYGPMLSPPKLGSSSLKGKLQFTNLVTMEVSTSTTTMREDNNYRNIRSRIAEETFQNGRLNSPKRALVILEGQRTGLSSETDLSPAFSSLPEEGGETRPKES